MSIFPEEFMLLAFNGYANSTDAGDDFLRILQQVGTEIWESDRLMEPDRHRVYIALRDIEPTYRTFLELVDFLPLADNDKEKARFRLVKLMDDLAVVVGHSVLTSNGRRLAQGLQGPHANRKKVEKASAKNRGMWEHIKAEAIKLGRELVDSDECGFQLAPGVLSRMGIKKDAHGKYPRGYSASTIRKQIRSILEERKRS